MNARMRRLRAWSWIHTWSSLICTLFLLMLCVTGLPLIFKAEIDAWSRPPAPRPVVSAEGAPILGLDRLVEIARTRYPDLRMRVVEPYAAEPVVSIFMGTTPEPGPGGRWMLLDKRTGEAIEQTSAATTVPFTSKVMGAIDELHSEMFAGEAGELLLFVMALLFVASLVSGTIVYGPFARGQAFGTVRYERSSWIVWLDLHKLLGIVTLAWACVVGGTGALNTLSGMMLDRWQSQALPALTAAYRSQEVVRDPTSLEQALAVAHQAAPGMNVGTVMFPNRNWGSPNHYFMLATGTTPLTSRLRTAILVDARTGALTAAQPFPWYLRLIEVSRPLHFGDYGGLPLKILWALLDVVTLVVLVSGLVLWFRKRRHARDDAREARTATSSRAQRGMSVRRRRRSVWLWPAGLAMLTTFGLLCALLGTHMLWRALSWASLAVPVAVIVRFTLRKED